MKSVLRGIDSIGATLNGRRWLLDFVAAVAAVCALYFGLRAEITATRHDHEKEMVKIGAALRMIEIADSVRYTDLHNELLAHRDANAAQWVEHDTEQRREWDLIQRQWILVWRRLGVRYIPER